jgi:hypothetical protein
LPTVSLTVDNTDIAEAGGVATFTATLSEAATTDVTVALGYSGTATDADDYTASDTQIVIATGATSGSVTVTAVDDAIDDDAETVIVDITGVTGAANENGEQQATTTITDDDEPAVEPGNRFSIPKDLTAAPGAAVAVPVNIELVELAAPQRLLGLAVVVGFDDTVLTLDSVTSGDFITGNGWTLINNPGAGQVILVGFTTTATTGPLMQTLANLNFTVAAGATPGPISLNILDRSGAAITEMLDASDGVIPLADPVTADPADQADGVLTIGAAGPTVSLAVDNADIAEAGGVATFTATLSETATADVTVDLGFGGTATDTDDYTASGAQIVIATGATSGSVTVTAVDDAIDDDAETVVVDITGVTGATENGEQQATTTITDDDDPIVLPTVSLTVDNAEIDEAGGVATFTATLSAASTADVTVELGITGTAANAADYTASGTQIVILAGSTTGLVTVTAIDDDLNEDDETVVVDITSVTNATGSGVATTTILDNDDPGASVTLSVDNDAVPEAGGVATITATLSVVLTADVTVALGYTGTATDAVDYTASATQLVIAAGSTTASATVTAIQDALVEPNESVIVDITSVTGALESGEQQVIVTIGDDDGVNDPPELENPGNLSFAETQDTFDVTLVATDPNPGDTLTFTAVVEGAELYLDQTLELNFAGDFFTNFSSADTGGRVELNEKWLLAGDGRTWYYIEPNGDFSRWLGGGVLNREFVSRVSTAAYDDPSLLYDAQPGGVVSPVTATVTNNVVTFDPPAGFVGAFTVLATVSDGERTDSETFLIDVQQNVAPTLENPGDQTLPTNQDTLDVELVATDSMNDAITLTAVAQSGEYYLDQTIGLKLGPNGTERNWTGSLDEQWVLSDDDETWYFITPDGSFYRWSARGNRDILPNSELVAQLSPATHADPSLLYDAQEGAAVPATVTITGSTLTIDPNAGFVGTFAVMLTATDVGGLTDTELIRVDVTAAPAGGIQIPLNFAGRPTGGVVADAVLAEGELGFQADSLGLADSGEELAAVHGNANASDSAFEELFEDDLLADDITENLALNFLR